MKLKLILTVQFLQLLMPLGRVYTGLIEYCFVVATKLKGCIDTPKNESRLFFVDKLIDMGAKIMLCDPHRAVVMGHDF
jgi:UDP-N-acetylglucosamine enolpyruvyl transferase